MDALLRKIRRLYHLLHGDRILRFYSDTKTSINIPSVKANYERQLQRVRAKLAAGGKLKVVFLVSDASKWKMQSLFEAMAASKRFEPLIAVSQFGWHESRSSAEERSRKTMRFFGDLHLPVESACSYETHKAIPLSAFSPDIVFYQQPWDVEAAHDPVAVSKFALTCYVPYYVPNFSPQHFDYALPFHRTLFRYFLLNKICVDAYKDAMGKLSVAGSMVPTGHPMLDRFAGIDFGDINDDGVVIYAPHWTFPHKDNPNSANISTFLWTGRLMLEYAKSHAEIKWAFKPHPVLRGMLQKSGVMTLDEINSYYSEWEAIGESCYDGSYVDLFKRSRALVTDCASFLTEYACTGKPVIRMISPQAITKPGRFSEKLYSTYYQVHTQEELSPTLDRILVKRDDPNREARQSAAKAMNLLGVDAAGNIIVHLVNLLVDSDLKDKDV